MNDFIGNVALVGIIITSLIIGIIKWSVIIFIGILASPFVGAWWIFDKLRDIYGN